MKHAHDEAFKIMAYACECGHREMIWNSRDGVTPFSLGCPSCGNTSLRHVDWKRDVYAPEHKLFKGQRFWRDGTPDEAEAIMRRRIEQMRDEYPCTPEEEAALIAYARNDEGEFREGWPVADRYEPSAQPDVLATVREKLEAKRNSVSKAGVAHGLDLALAILAASGKGE